MSFLISDAMAQAEGGQAAQQPDAFVTLLPFIILFIIFYFLLIRPQSKRAKEHRNMVANLSQDDEVVTNGGMLGRITALDENFITLEVANGVQIQVQRQAVASVMPKGTYQGG